MDIRIARYLLAASVTVALLTQSSLPSVEAEYQPSTEVSLIVEASNAGHFRSALEQLQWLVRYRKVKAREVLAVDLPDGLGAEPRKLERTPHGSTVYDAAPAIFGSNYTILLDIGLPHFDTVVEHKRDAELELQYSPVWVVHHMGNRYVFEGWKNIRRYFDSRGKFVHSR